MAFMDRVRGFGRIVASGGRRFVSGSRSAWNASQAAKERAKDIYVRRLLQKEFQQYGQFRVLLRREYNLLGKTNLIGELKRGEDVLDKLLEIINIQLSAIGLLDKSRKKSKRIGLKLKAAFHVHGLNDAERAGPDVLSHVPHVQSYENSAAIRFYKDLFEATLEGDRIGEKIYRDESAAINAETRDLNVFAHLVLNLSKQMDIVKLMIVKASETDHPNFARMAYQGGNIISKLEGLLSDEKRFHYILIRDIRIISASEDALVKDVSDDHVAKAKRQSRKRSLAYLALSGGTMAFIAFFTASILTKPGHSAADITKWFQNNADKPVIELVEDLPKGDRDILEAAQERLSKEIASKTNIESAFDAQIPVWVDELYDAYTEELRKQARAISALARSGFNPNEIMPYNEGQVKEAMRKSILLVRDHVGRVLVLKIERPDAPLFSGLEGISLRQLTQPSGAGFNLNKGQQERVAQAIRDVGSQSIGKIKRQQKERIAILMEKAADFAKEKSYLNMEFLGRWIIHGYWLGIGLIFTPMFIKLLTFVPGKKSKKFREGAARLHDMALIQSIKTVRKNTTKNAVNAILPRLPRGHEEKMRAAVGNALRRRAA